jgi:iron complex transport system substrate-binding protein
MRKLIPLILLMAMTACRLHAAYPMKVTDARGKSNTISSRPSRIVALAPNVTEMLFALGLDDRVVGVNSQSDYPPAARKKPKVGDMTISAESVFALKPDLVIAHAYVNREAIARLEKLGLKVFALDPKSIPQVIADIRTVGRITARPKTAEKLAGSVERTIASVKTSRARKAVKDVLVVIQSNPLWVAGPSTFVHEMLGIANARNVAHDARPGFVTFSRELAIARNPDLIVVGVKSDADYFMKSPEWKNTKAVRLKHVYVINNDLLVRPGPRLAEGLNALAAKLNQ